MSNFELKCEPNEEFERIYDEYSDNETQTDTFTKPDRPFLLIYTDADDMISYTWLETEKDLMEVVEEVKEYGCTIIDAIEIGTCRNITLE